MVSLSIAVSELQRSKIILSINTSILTFQFQFTKAQARVGLLLFLY